MKLRTKWEQLENFVAALARKRVHKSAATNRTASEAKRLGIPVDDGEVSDLFEEHYSRNPAPTSTAGPRIRLKKKPKLKLKRRNGKRKGLLIQWRNTWRAIKDTGAEPGDIGLPSTTRLVLWEISGDMDMDGTGAYPGIKRIAQNSGLALSTVTTHIKLAIERGWLRKRRYMKRGRPGWIYSATFPKGAR